MEKQPHIAIIEDEKELALLIRDRLQDAGMTVSVFHRGHEAVAFLARSFVNLVLLDVNLPDCSGFVVFDELHRMQFDRPVIFLTATNSEIQKVRALEMGGDDYVTKPFSFPELLARIRAVLRRAETAGDTRVVGNVVSSDKPFNFCSCTLNPSRLEITFPDGEKVPIGRKELGILWHLAHNPNTVLSRKTLIHSVWGPHADPNSRSIDQYVSRIRDLFARHDVPMTELRTIHGVGYILDLENTTQTASPKKRKPSKKG